MPLHSARIKSISANSSYAQISRNQEMKLPMDAVGAKVTLDSPTGHTGSLPGLVKTKRLKYFVDLPQYF